LGDPREVEKLSTLSEVVYCSPTGHVERKRLKDIGLKIKQDAEIPKILHVEVSPKTLAGTYLIPFKVMVGQELRKEFGIFVHIEK